MVQIIKVFSGVFFILVVGVTLSFADDVEKKDIVIKAKGIHEECVNVTPREALSYSFKTSKPISFNVHFHTGKDIFYPVLKEGVTEEEGAFTPEKEDFYCLMWTNDNKEPTTLTRSFKVEKK